MKFTKILRTTALAASLAAVLGLAAAPSAMADTATGNTTFKVILQPTTLLYYYGEIDLTVPSSALLSLAGGAPTNLGTSPLTGSAGTGTLSADAAIVPGAAASLSNVALTLSNVWAVRSITTPGTGNTTVTVSFASGTGAAVTTATLTGSATSSTATIGLSNLATSNGSFAGTGFGTAQKGNLTMTMNLSNASTADTYKGAVIYITATSS